jgi:hypothetical protein
MIQVRIAQSYRQKTFKNTSIADFPRLFFILRERLEDLDHARMFYQNGGG